MRWIPLADLFESVLPKSRTGTKSGRREILGFGTRRDMIGFETKGERKNVPKRKRPKKIQSIINRTGLRSKATIGAR